MKNHKGAIATLLTLGLVVIGSLITLGSSLFVNNQKNIASNPRAEVVNCAYSLTNCNRLIQMGECPGGNMATTCTSYKCSNGKYRCPGTIDNSSSSTVARVCTPNIATIICIINNCTGSKKCKADGSGYDACIDKPNDNCPAVAQTGVNQNPVACNAPNTTKAISMSGICSGASGCGSYDKYVSQTEHYPQADQRRCCCKGTVVAPVGQGVDCGMTVATASNDCTNGIDKTGCLMGTAKCKATVSTSAAGIPGNDTTANQITDNPVVGEGQSCCFQKKGKVYVFASYLSMVNSDMLDDNGAPECKRQSAAVISSYQADPALGAFVCAGGTQNETPIADYNADNPVELPEDIISTNTCEAKGYTCVNTVGKSPLTACSPNKYIKNQSCNDTTKTCCDGPGGGVIGGSGGGENTGGTTNCTPTQVTCPAGRSQTGIKYFYKSTDTVNCGTKESKSACYGYSTSSCTSYIFDTVVDKLCGVAANAPAANNPFGAGDNSLQCTSQNCPYNQGGPYYYRAQTNKFFPDLASCNNRLNNGSDQTSVMTKVCPATNAQQSGQPPAQAIILPPSVGNLGLGQSITFTTNVPMQIITVLVKDGDKTCNNLNVPGGPSYYPVVKDQHNNTIIPTQCTALVGATL